MLFLVLLVTILTLVYYWIKKCYGFWAKYNIPSPPVKFPFGNIKGLGTSKPAFIGLTEISEKYRNKYPAIGLYFFLSPTLLVMDIDLTKNILQKDFSDFHDRGFYYNKVDDPLSANLLTLEGNDWRDRRAKLTSVFTSGKIKFMFDIINSIGDKFVSAIDKSLTITNDLEMGQMLYNFFTDVISNVAFGIDSNCLENEDSEFAQHGRRLFKLNKLEILKVIFANGNHKLARKLRLHANPKEPCDFLLRTFTETLKYRETSKIERHDFIHLLLKLKETMSLTNIEMAAESFLFFAAGFETSSSTMTFCLYELAQHIEIQERLRQEIQSGLDENEGKITYDLLFKFEYLDMVVKETLRKYAVIPVLLRKCLKDYRIPKTNMTIPAGVNVMILNSAIQRDPNYYPDPDKFDPERFSSVNSNRNPLTFLPFGEGPRNCIGSRFGLLQVKLCLVKLLANFKFTISDRTTIPMEYNVSSPFMAPKNGMWLSVEKISTDQ